MVTSMVQRNCWVWEWSCHSPLQTLSFLNWFMFFFLFLDLFFSFSFFSYFYHVLFILFYSLENQEFFIHFKSSAFVTCALCWIFTTMVNGEERVGLNNVFFFFFVVIKVPTLNKITTQQNFNTVIMFFLQRFNIRT